MISVRAPSRLHFGLLSVPLGQSWPNQEGIVARRFGSVGLMIQDPGVTLKIRPAMDWSAEGPLAERALTFAHQFAESFPPAPSKQSQSPQHILVEHCSPEHAGLGTGTQLGLAVARVLQEAWGLPPPEPSERGELARRIGRGARSALGVHGFFEGGFLVEAGKRSGESLAPLVARVIFPESWRIVLVVPPGRPGLHGLEESEAFEKLQGIPQEKTDTLCRLVLLGMLPALAEKDWKTFGEALHEFNARAGETFASIQGGVYAGEAVGEIVRYIRQQGIPGAGQSSWGPAVFAMAADEDQARSVCRQVQEKFSLQPSCVFITSARNEGAEIRSLAQSASVSITNLRSLST
jgi:beta-RFAP synthase